jgi:putative hydrolase of the HAD superfamily
MEIRAIVFDLDDTLFEERQYVLSGFKAVDRWVAERFGAAGFGETAAFLFNLGLRNRIFNRALDSLRLSYDEHLIQEMVECYRAHMPDIQLAEDARWVLEHVKDSVKLGLLSDGYLISQERKIAALGLAGMRFAAIVLTDRLGRKYWKPSPRPYWEICSRLSLAPQACLYVGDNASKDFISPNRLGWTTVRIRRPNGLYAENPPNQAYEAHYVIDDLRQMSEIPLLKPLFKKEVTEEDVQPIR